MHSVGEIGAIMPEGEVAPAALVGDEMLSRVYKQGRNASPYILTTMRNDPRAEVQAQGCRALSQIAESAEGRKAGMCSTGFERTVPGVTRQMTPAYAPLRLAVIAEGGIQVIVEAMETATDEEVELQARGCSALANLVVGEGEAAVFEHGGLAVVLAAAAAPPTAASVQLKCCAALGNMAYGSAGEAKVLAEGGIEVVVAAMKVHPQDAKLQEEGCDALVNIADSAAGM